MCVCEHNWPMSISKLYVSLCRKGVGRLRSAVPRNSIILRLCPHDARGRWHSQFRPSTAGCSAFPTTKNSSSTQRLLEQRRPRRIPLLLVESFSVRLSDGLATNSSGSFILFQWLLISNLSEMLPPTRWLLLFHLRARQHNVHCISVPGDVLSHPRGNSRPRPLGLRHYRITFSHFSPSPNESLLVYIWPYIKRLIVFVAVGDPSVTLVKQWKSFPAAAKGF